MKSYKKRYFHHVLSTVHTLTQPINLKIHLQYFLHVPNTRITAGEDKKASNVIGREMRRGTYNQQMHHKYIYNYVYTMIILQR